MSLREKIALGLLFVISIGCVIHYLVWRADFKDFWKDDEL